MSRCDHKSVSELQEAIFLDVDTGMLYWRNRPKSHFATEVGWKIFNASYAGKEAFTTVSDGYKIGTIWNIGGVKAHQVVFAIHYGRWPVAVDHIDGNPENNRPENLRECGQEQNNRNLRLRRDNPTGVTGVRKAKANGRFSCRIGVGGGKSVYLGSYGCITAAIIARKSAEVSLKYHKNHGRPHVVRDALRHTTNPQL